MELLLRLATIFYRAISGTDKIAIYLEKMELYKSDVELVEVENDKLFCYDCN